MDSLYIPPIPEPVISPPPLEQLTPEERRKQRVLKIIQNTGPVLHKIFTGLERIIEDVAESIMRR